MPDRDALLAAWAKKWPKCDHQVGAAVIEFYSKITSSHSWESRKFSLVSLARKYVDEEVERFFQRNHVPDVQSFSDHLREGASQAIDWLDWVSTRYSVNSEVSATCFSHTVAMLRDLVIVCANLRSKDGKLFSVGDPDKGDDVVRRRARRASGRSQFDELPWYLQMPLVFEPGVYCELCDKVTEHHRALLAYTGNGATFADGINNGHDVIQIRIGGHSRRYCKVHDPELSFQAYKKAGRRRVAFYSLMCLMREGERLLHGRPQTKPNELRAAAYQVLTSSNNLRQFKLAEAMVENFFANQPESASGYLVREHQLIEAYRHYFGADKENCELPSVFRLPTGGFHATRFSSCCELSQSSMNRAGDL